MGEREGAIQTPRDQRVAVLQDVRLFAKAIIGSSIRRYEKVAIAEVTRKASTVNANKNGSG
jgi:hypothetical protein